MHDYESTTEIDRLFASGLHLRPFFGKSREDRGRAGKGPKEERRNKIAPFSLCGCIAHPLSTLPTLVVIHHESLFFFWQQIHYWPRILEDRR
jgi:hypothetical protein